MDEGPMISRAHLLDNVIRMTAWGLGGERWRTGLDLGRGFWAAGR